MGCSGGCITTLSMCGASGIEAACTRPLTTDALASAAVPKNPRRENIVASMSVAAIGRRCRGDGGWIVAAGSRRAAAVDRGLQVGLGKEESLPCIDCTAQRREPLPRFGEQRKNIDLHAGEAELHLLRDDLAQRHDLALVVAGDVVAGAIDPISIACLGA